MAYKLNNCSFLNPILGGTKFGEKHKRMQEIIKIKYNKKKAEKEKESFI